MKKKFIIKVLCAAVIFSSALGSINVKASTMAAKTSNDPAEITADMGVGWNLGNTLDSYTYDELWFDGSNPKAWESIWGNEPASKEMIDKIKESGFNTVRIPITWGPHMGEAPEYKVDAAWMKRVQEVVDYCRDNDIYTIIDVHHDETWCIPNYENEEASIEKLKKLWSQIADNFKDYDNSLIFEVLNEPREIDPNDAQKEWMGTSEGHDVVNKLNAAALETIRKTGGNNAERTVIIPTYAASSDDDSINDLVIPEDKHIIVSLHAYKPFEFAKYTEDYIPVLKYMYSFSYPQEYIDSIDWNKLLTKWGSYDSDKQLISEFDKYHDKFIAKGIPVVLDEFGALNKNNTADRAAYSAFYVSEAKKRGMACILWDNGDKNGLGFFDRKNLTWYYPEIRNAIINAYNSTEKN